MCVYVCISMKVRLSIYRPICMCAYPLECTHAWVPKPNCSVYVFRCHACNLTYIIMRAHMRACVRLCMRLIAISAFQARYEINIFDSQFY